ncbi:MAG: MFS transporter, partial [Chloroflexota bacterium]
MDKRVGERFYYGWVVVGVTALTLLVAAGVRSAPGVFIYPLQIDFGWTRAAISFAVALGLILYGLAGPLAGSLVDRHGPRLLMLVGLLTMAVAMALSATVSDIWQLDLFWGVLSGLGTGFAAAVLGAAVANRWFVARRGLVLGIFGAATSAGQLVFVPLLMYLVLAVGWRASSLFLAGAALAVLVPVWLLMRDEPGQVGLRALGARQGQATSAGRTPGIMREALRT